MFKVYAGRRKLLVFIAFLVLLISATYQVYDLHIVRQWSREKGDISLSTARRANSFIGPISRKATQEVVDLTLKNAGYKKWEKFKKELRVLTCETDVYPGEGEEFLVALSLLPHEGMVAAYKREGGKLKYIGKIGNLLPVTDLSGVNNVYAGRNMLVVDQHQDEMLGAFFNAGYRDIFVWKDGHFDRILGLVTAYNAFWNQAWDGVKNGASWLWLRQVSETQYGEGGKRVEVTYNQSLLQSMTKDVQQIPGEEDFVVRYNRTVRDGFTWSGEWNRYILGEYTDRLTGKKVAVLENYGNNISGLIGKTVYNMVKVMDEEGNIEIIPCEQLE